MKGTESEAEQMALLTARYQPCMEAPAYDGIDPLVAEREALCRLYGVSTDAELLALADQKEAEGRAIMKRLRRKSAQTYAAIHWKGPPKTEPHK